MSNELNTPWRLAFDRDGTEDFGVIVDGEGREIVSSQHCKTCWLPEDDNDVIPALVRQMQLMTAAPKLLAMLKIAIATADPATHKWVAEAWTVIAEATGQEAPEPTDTPKLHQAARQLYAALAVAEAMLEEYLGMARAVDRLLKSQGELVGQIEQVHREAVTALCAARGEIAF